MPRILRIINRLNLGGPTYNVAYLTKHLAPEFETLLVAGIKEDSEESSEYILDEMNLKVVILPSMQRRLNFFNDYNTYKQLLKLIKEYKPDIVHTHAAKAGAVGRIAAWRAGVPVIVHTFHGHVFHSYFSKFKTRLYIEIERFLAKRSTAIVAISEIQKEELALKYKICPENKINVIHLGFDLSRFSKNIPEKRAGFRQKFNIGEEEIAIGIVGRIVPIKNHPLFLDAVKLLLEKTRKKVKVLVIGDGESRMSVQNHCKAIGLEFSEGRDFASAPVLFTSWIKEIDEAYAGLDIVALSSLNEGTPVSLIEAQAAGKPIVSTRVGGIENVVHQGKSALLCDQDPAAFAAHLLTLVEDPNLRASMSNEGKLVKERFTYMRLVENTRKLYYKLLQSNIN